MEDQGVRSSWDGLRMPVMTDYKPKWDLGDNPPIVYTLELLPDPLFRGDTPVPELLGILVPDHSQLCPSVGVTLNELLCLMQHLFPGIQDMEIQRSNTLDSIWSISEEPPISSPPWTAGPAVTMVRGILVLCPILPALLPYRCISLTTRP